MTHLPQIFHLGRKSRQQVVLEFELVHQSGQD